MLIKSCVLVLVLVNSLWRSSAEGSNVLILSPITAPSHSNFIRPVVKELAKRGHTVTYWNGLKPDKEWVRKMPNVRYLFSDTLGDLNDNHHTEVGFDDRTLYRRFKHFFYNMARMLEVYCTAIYQDPIFHQLMTTDEHFDLVVVDGVFNDCVLPLVHKFRAPLVYLNSIAATPWQLDAVGAPLALDHLPNPGMDFADEMPLWQRTLNTVTTLAGIYYRHWVILPSVDRVAERMLGHANLTAVREIEDHYLSLLVTNTHFSINYQHPKTATVVEAGGLHCYPPRPLPKDLEEFVNGSGDEGFIVVSFGSILRGASMSPEMRRTFITTFSRLKQRVVWKWEDETRMSTDADLLPSNVKLVPWLPQQDLLGHPKARLFITHGGLFSHQEAVYHGVPFVAMPVFADQFTNAKKAHDDGYAVHFDWDQVAEEGALYDTIQHVLKNPKYAAKMQFVSELMRDQKERPLDRAVYWIEYVMRHGGAQHLRSASRKLALYQRGLLDVTLIVVAVSFVLAYAAYLFFLWTVSKWSSSASSNCAANNNKLTTTTATTTTVSRSSSAKKKKIQ